MPTSGNLYILTAPSGAGKTTLAHRLVSSMPNVQLSISYTTRPPRANETTGKDYFFVDPAIFEKMRLDGAFLEYANVHGYWYGTSSAQIAKNTAAGIDVILAIDWQGAQKIREVWKKEKRIQGNLASIFILPPSQKTLRQRLHQRGQDDEAVIQKRLDAAKGEIAHYAEFDYLVVNDVLEKALKEIQMIIDANRLPAEKQAVDTSNLSVEKQALKYAKLLAEWAGDA
jgi:guanylate kinase